MIFMEEGAHEDKSVLGPECHMALISEKLEEPTPLKKESTTPSLPQEINADSIYQGIFIFIFMPSISIPVHFFLSNQERRQL